MMETQKNIAHVANDISEKTRLRNWGNTPNDTTCISTLIGTKLSKIENNLQARMLGKEVDNSQ